MNLDDKISINNFESTLPLVQTMSGWYVEKLVENYTGETVYILQPDGTISEVPPIAGMSSIIKKIIIKTESRTGLPLPDIAKPGYVGAPKFPVTEITVAYERLLAGPYYSYQSGIAVCLGTYKDQMVEQNLLNPDFVSTKIQSSVRSCCESGVMVPVVVNANCHNSDIDYLYLIVNKLLMSVQVQHNLNANECLIFHVNRKNSHSDWTVENVDWNNLQIREENFGKAVWVFGTDLKQVQLKLDNLITEEENKFTYEEMKHKVNLETENLHKDLEIANDSLEQTKKELVLVRKDLDNTKFELTKTNDASRMSVDQQMNAYKLASAIEESKLASERRELAREQAIFDLKRDKEKADMDYKIQDAKVRKEIISVSSAETSNTGAAIKTAAVVVPVVVGAGMWVVSHSTAAAVVASVAAVVASWPISGTAIAVGAAVAGVCLIASWSWDKIKSGFKCIGRFVSSVVSGAISIVNDIVNIMLNAVSCCFNCICNLFS